MGNEQSTTSSDAKVVDHSNQSSDTKSVSLAKNERKMMPGSEDATVSSQESAPSTPSRRSVLTWEKPRPL